MGLRVIQTLQTCTRRCTTSIRFLFRLVQANMIPVSRLSQ
jgi:hypothetical protein